MCCRRRQTGATGSSVAAPRRWPRRKRRCQDPAQRLQSVPSRLANRRLPARPVCRACWATRWTRLLAGRLPAEIRWPARQVGRTRHELRPGAGSVCPGWVAGKCPAAGRDRYPLRPASAGEPGATLQGYALIRLGRFDVDRDRRTLRSRRNAHHTDHPLPNSPAWRPDAAATKWLVEVSAPELRSMLIRRTVGRS